MHKDFKALIPLCKDTILLLHCITHLPAQAFNKIAMVPFLISELYGEYYIIEVKAPNITCHAVTFTSQQENDKYLKTFYPAICDESKSHFVLFIFKGPLSNLAPNAEKTNPLTSTAAKNFLEEAAKFFTEKYLINRKELFAHAKRTKVADIS